MCEMKLTEVGKKDRGGTSFRISKENNRVFYTFEKQEMSFRRKKNMIEVGINTVLCFLGFQDFGTSYLYDNTSSQTKTQPHE